MDSEDEKLFLGLFNLNEVEFLKSGFMKQPTYEIYDKFDDPNAQPPYSKVYICFKKDLNRITFDKVEDGSYWMSGTINPVIEFIRSRPDRETKKWISGRIWFEFKYWVKDENGKAVLLQKDDALKKLYEKLERWIRKHFRKDSLDYYVGPHLSLRFKEKPNS